MALNTQEVVQQNIEEKLQSLGITLPEASTPLANFVPYVISGSHVFISGQVPLENGQACFVGQVGDTISPEQAYRAAQLCAINILAQLKAACDGDLSRVKRIVRLGGFVNATPEFTQHSVVINGASDLFAEVFADKGRHARAAVGVSSLPRGVSVEVEAVVEIESSTKDDNSSVS